MRKTLFASPPAVLEILYFRKYSRAKLFGSKLRGDHKRAVRVSAAGRKGLVTAVHYQLGVPFFTALLDESVLDLGRSRSTVKRSERYKYQFVVVALNDIRAKSCCKTVDDITRSFALRGLPFYVADQINKTRGGQ